MANDWVGQFNQDLLAQALSQSMTKESTSNSVAEQNNPDMTNLLAKARELGDVYDRALSARGRREELEGQAPVSGQEKLLSARNIPLALAALAAGASGSPQAAAGIGVGALEGSNLAARQENVQRGEELGQARKAEETALNRVEAFHGRVNNQLITNWQALIDETGEQTITPEAAGLMASGAFGIPLDFTIKAKQMELRHDPGKPDRLNFLFKVGMMSDTEEDAVAWARDIFTELGRTDIPQEEVDRLGRALFQDAQREAAGGGPATGESLLAKLTLWLVKEADAETVLPALKEMANVDDPLQDMSWTASLTWNNAKAARGMDVDTRELNQSIDTFSAYVTDPANAETIAAINQTHGEGTGEALRNMAINAFRGRENLLIAWDKWAELNIDVGVSTSDVLGYAIEYQQMLPLMEIMLADMMQGQPTTRMEQIGGTEKFLEMIKTAQNMATIVGSQTAPLVITGEISTRLRQANEALAIVGFTAPEGQPLPGWVGDRWKEALNKYPNDLNSARTHFDNIIKGAVKAARNPQGTTNGE